jgi:hypothetical protein
LPRKHCFDASSRGDAEKDYHKLVTAFLDGRFSESQREARPRFPLSESSPPAVAEADTVAGSLLPIASSLLRYEASPIRKEGELRRQGSISKKLYLQRKLYTKEFSAF